MQTALGVVGGLLIGAAVGWGIASTYPRSGGASVATAEADVDAPLFQLDGKKYTVADLPTQVRATVFESQHESYERVSGMLTQFALQLALAKAKDPNAKPDALPPFEQLLGIEKPSDEELRKVFDANKSRLPPNTSFDQVKTEIERYVANGKISDALQAKSQELRAGGRYKLLLVEPQAPVVDLKVDRYPFRGAKDAAVTLVEASDYLCPHCQAAHPEIEAMLAELGDKVRFVHVAYSRNPEALSGGLARGAFCAQQQSDAVFWKFNDAAFKLAKEKGWSLNAPDDKNSVEAVAKAAEADTAALGLCVGSAAAKDFVKTTVETMNAAGIAGTPTFWLNGRRVVNHEPAALKEQILRQLQAQSH